MRIVKIRLEGLKFIEETVLTELTETEACELCEILNKRIVDFNYYYQVMLDEKF